MIPTQKLFTTYLNVTRCNFKLEFQILKKAFENRVFVLWDSRTASQGWLVVAYITKEKFIILVSALRIGPLVQISQVAQVFELTEISNSLCFNNWLFKFVWETTTCHEQVKLNCFLLNKRLWQRENTSKFPLFTEILNMLWLTIK